MAYGNPNSIGRLHSSNSLLEGHDQLGLTIRQTGLEEFTALSHRGVGSQLEFTSFPYISPSVGPARWENVQKISQHYSHVADIDKNQMVSSMKQNIMESPHTCTSLTNNQNNFFSFHGTSSQMSQSEGNVNVGYSSLNGDNVLNRYGSMDGGVGSSSFLSPIINANIMQDRSIAGGSFTKATHLYDGDASKLDSLMKGGVRSRIFQNAIVNTNITQTRGVDKVVKPDNLINHSSCFQNPMVNMSLMKSGSVTSGVYSEANPEVNYSLNEPRLCADSYNSWSGKPVLFQNSNFHEIEINNDVKMRAVQLDSSVKVDGNFLTLGMGDNKMVTSGVFGTREMVSKSEETVSSQINNSPIRQPTGGPLNLTHSFKSGLTNIQRNADGLSSSSCNLDYHAFCPSDGVWLLGASTALSSNTSYSLQRLHPEYSNVNNDRNHSFAFANSNLKSPEPDPCRGSQVVRAPSPLPFTHSSLHLTLPPSNSAGFALHSGKPARLSTPPSLDQLKNCRDRSIRNTSLASPRVSHHFQIGGSSITQGHCGTFIPHVEGDATQLVVDRQIPLNPQSFGEISSAQNVRLEYTQGHNVLTGGLNSQSAGSNNVNHATGSPFPKRLGVQGNHITSSQAHCDTLFAKEIGIQPASNLHRTCNYRPVQLSSNNIRPPVIGPPQGSLHSHLDLGGCSCASGPVIPFVNVPSHVSNVPGPPLLKRKADALLPVPQRGQRRKIVQPVMQQSLPSQKQGLPVSVSAHSPSPPHIKWPGFDEPPQPTGHKCLLCMRDLVFTPEGHVFQPAIPPAVAVLPCGHAFHDQCLENITLEGQAKDPPCIPCVIGET